MLTPDRVEALQRQQLKRLLKKADACSYLKQWIHDSWDYERFALNLPIVDYVQLEPWIKRIKEGESDLLWPGKMRRFAVSSGTTGKGKHLPLSEDRLRSDRRFTRILAWNIITSVSKPWELFGGSMLSIPGQVEELNGLLIGEVSGHLAQTAPNMLAKMNVKNPKIWAKWSWDKKIEEAKHLWTAHPRVIVGVPSWLVGLFEEWKRKDEASLDQIKGIICGGVKLSNYLEELRKLVPRAAFFETYGASEAYFSYGRAEDQGWLFPMMDNGHFLELEDEQGSIAPIWSAEEAKDYRAVISTNSGLWRYRMDDRLEFSWKGGLKMRVKGRWSLKLDDFGEALEWEEMKATWTQMGFGRRFLVIAVNRKQGKGHLYIYVSDKELTKEQEKELDLALADQNRHYHIRRETKALVTPSFIRIPKEQMDDLQNVWRKGVQTKPLCLLSISHPHYEKMLRLIQEEIDLGLFSKS